MELQTQCDSRALRSTLMLGCTCTIHLGIQWPMIRCSKYYAQHQHGRLQGLCPTLPIIFSCVLEFLTQHKCKYSCAPELLAEHKTAIYPCAPELLTQQKTSHQSCASRSTPNTNKHIYIYHQQLAYAQYIKQISFFHMQYVLRPSIS